MALRKAPIVSGEIYHIFNRSIAQQPIFASIYDYQRAAEVFKFYIYDKPPLRFSFYSRLPKDQKSKFIEELVKSSKALVEVLCFCLMPNHLHFLLKNLSDNGINKFMSNFQNSYAKFFNTKTGRTGSLFQQNFKAVRIETDEQLIHVSRYIHLNPITAYLVKTIEELESYFWSSYPEYLKKEKVYFLKKDLVLDHFKSIKDYKNFVTDQVDYQRELNKIRHLTLEE